MKFTGIVGKGKGYGVTLGFPTANIPLTDASVSGIYAASVVLEGKKYGGAAYADQKRGLLEVHLLDFSGDLYGKEIQVTLGDKIREDAEFDTTEALKAQIEEDIATIQGLSRTI